MGENPIPANNFYRKEDSNKKPKIKYAPTNNNNNINIDI